MIFLFKTHKYKVSKKTYAVNFFELCEIGYQMKPWIYGNLMSEKPG